MSLDDFVIAVGTAITSYHKGGAMAGWGDDPELERLRALVDEGWEVVEITEVPNAAAGPSDTVRLQRGDEVAECSSDHLAFHRYVEYLREEET